MVFLISIPALFSSLVLAAHFFRNGQLLLTLACCLAPWLLAFRATWATRVLQFLLFLGALEWVRTILSIAAERAADGRPWHRMAIILGSVSLTALLSALWLKQWPHRQTPGLALSSPSELAQSRTENRFDPGPQSGY